MDPYFPDLHPNRRSFLRWLGAGTALALVPVRPAPATAAMAPTRIPTATGHIFSNRMGITSVHEHIPMPTDPSLREESMRFAIDELKKAKALGLQTIIDVGPTADVKSIREVSEASGVNVVCCTGSYVLRKDQQSMSVADFENHMRSQIEDGIQATQLRPRQNRILRSLRRDPWAASALLFLIVVIATALLSPIIVPDNINSPSFGSRLLPPLSEGHIAGTDQLGRDVWGRLLLGSRISLFVGFVTVLFAALGMILSLAAAAVSLAPRASRI